MSIAGLYQDLSFLLCNGGHPTSHASSKSGRFSSTQHTYGDDIYQGLTIGRDTRPAFLRAPAARESEQALSVLLFRANSNNEIIMLAVQDYYYIPSVVRYDTAVCHVSPRRSSSIP